MAAAAQDILELPDLPLGTVQCTSSTKFTSLTACIFAVGVVFALLQHNVDETVAAVQDILELPGLSFELEEVVDQEWVEQIKASYVPVQVRV